MKLRLRVPLALKALGMKRNTSITIRTHALKEQTSKTFPIRTYVVQSVYEKNLNSEVSEYRINLLSDIE